MSDKFKIWWRAVRPFAYPASVTPVLLGAAVAWSQGVHISFALGLVAVVGAVAAHTGANLINDYMDFKKGVDREGTLGGSGILVEGILKPGDIFWGSAVFFTIAAVCALIACYVVGLKLMILIVIGLIAGAGYVLPPFGLKYRALGDVTVFIAFGIGVTLGSYMIQTGYFSWTPVIYAIPIGMLVAAILHSNNIRDMVHDKDSQVKTLAGLMGQKVAKFFYAFLVLGAYLAILLSIIFGVVAPFVALVFLTIPIAWRLVIKMYRTKDGESVVLMDAKTAQLNLLFGLAMIAGVALGKNL